MRDATAENNQTVLVLAKLGLSGLSLGLGLPVFVWFSWLREDGLFWRNEGGYAVWLRDLVLATYYPIFAANLLLAVGIFALFLLAPPRTKFSIWVQLTVLGLMVGTMFCCGIYIVAVADHVLDY